MLRGWLNQNPTTAVLWSRNHSPLQKQMGPEIINTHWLKKLIMSGINARQHKWAIYETTHSLSACLNTRQNNADHQRPQQGHRTIQLLSNSCQTSVSWSWRDTCVNTWAQLSRGLDTTLEAQSSSDWTKELSLCDCKMKQMNEHWVHNFLSPFWIELADIFFLH